MNNFVVYCAKHNGKIVYIGSGKKGRQHHCNSGVSSCKLLNQLYFTSDIPIEVELLKQSLTKEQSICLEKELIKKYLPIGNIQYISNSRQVKGIDRITLFRKIDEDFNSINYSKKEMWRDTLKDCIKEYDLVIGKTVAIKSNSKIRDSILSQRIFRIFWHSLQGSSSVKLVECVHNIFCKYLTLTQMDKIFYLQLNEGFLNEND